MASSNEEIGFDLDLLLPSPTADNATAKLEYLRKSIRLVKTRTILSNTLVTQILGLRKELDSAKNSLVASNRERDEWYTSYNHGCASVKNLEMEIKKLQIKNKELEEKCFITTNQYDAVKSHAHQLQLLVKENKKKRGAAKIENVLDTYNKDHENTITLLKQNEQTLLHDISLMRDILIGKKKLQQGHKRLILKYMKLKVLSDSDEFIFGDEDIQDDDNIIFNGLATFCDENTLDNIDRKDQNSQTLIKKKINENNVDMIVIDEKTNPADNGHNSDCGNEGISVDTGRGSSVSDLALSDTEKCLHSPDYVMDSSPLSIDAIDSNKDQVKVIDVTTSPPISTRDIATSPIIFEDVSSNHHDSSVDVVHSVDRGESPTHIITREFATSPTHIITREFSTSPTHIITRDFSTSPTNIITLEVSTSPIQKHGQEEITSCEFFNNRTSGYVHDRESNSVRKEKECMELNNSKNLFDDSSIDNEIETILNTMRINYELVTPIPLSPSKSRNINITQGTNELETLNSKAIKSFSATFNEMSENLKEIKRMLINRDGAYTRRNSIQQDKNENIQTFISDLRDGNLTEEKSTNNIVVRDNDILPLRTKSPSNKARELEGEFNDSVSAYSINSVLTDTSGDRIIQNPKRVKNLSTNNTVVATGDKIRQESQSTKIPSNKAQSEELNGSVPITSGPTTELSTNLVASDFDNLHESRIDISSSNTSKRIQIIDSRILHSTTTFASDKLSVNNIDDVETSQEEIGNMSIQNTTFRLQHDSSKGFEENTDTINDSISEVETTNLSTLNQNRNNETEYAYETLQEHCQKKNMKKKKLTKLDKLRKKMLPKSKIRCTTPVKKICKKPKPVPIYTKVVKESDSAASLNDRSIYENAVKVMAVINSKPKEVSNEEGSSSHRAQNISTTVTPVSPEKSNFKQHNKNNNEMPLSPMSAMITRSRSKNDKNSPCSVVRNLELLFDTTSSPNSFSKNESDINAVTNSGTQGTRKRRKGASNDQSEIACKRMLRSSTVKKQPILETEIELEKSSAKHLSHTSDKNRNKDITNKNISHKSADFQSSKVVSDHQTLFNKSDSVNENNKAYKNKNSKERVIMDKNENTCVPNTPRNVSVILNENISQKSADVQTSTVVSDHQTLLNKSDSVHENNKACKNKNSKMRAIMDKNENTCVPNTPKNVSGILNQNISHKSADVQSSKVVSDHQILFSKSDSVNEHNKACNSKNSKMRVTMDESENNCVPNTPKNVSVILNENISQKSADVKTSTVVSDHQTLFNKSDSVNEHNKACNSKNSKMRVTMDEYENNCEPNTPKNVSGIPNKNVSYKSADVQSSKVVSDHQTLFNKSDSVKENNKARKRKNNKMRDAMDKYENNLVPNTPKNVSDPCVELTDIRRDNVVSYSDLQLFSNNNVSRKEKEKSVKDTVFESSHKNPKNSILCVMLQKYGIDSVKNAPKNVAEPATNSVCKMIENNITEILALPATEVKDALNDFVAEIQSLEDNLFIMGLMKYLKDPERRNELFNTVYSPPAPCMTKPEQVLIYVVTQLNSSSPTNDFVVKILDNIEYILFKLNQTPEFATVESMSHFYAVLCRYFNAKSRLRLFILDAMYCIQFKAIALIKQCLDVWMHILPLAHMGIAKNPLVTCLVYLLHFYKCEDKYNRVQAMRTILNRKYFYEITEWNEPKILEMFRNALKEMKDIAVEKKMLRIALIIMAKRHGPKWCQHNIIKNLLLPMIDSQNVDNKVKIFCISMIGPLLKPYPVEMKVHCEIIINQLQNMMQQKLPCAMHEAILMSLVYMSRHNPYRVNQALLSWEAKRVSRELENVLRDYVREKSVHVWKINLSKIGNSNRE